jgi:hypothetical protein
MNKKAILQIIWVAVAIEVVFLIYVVVIQREHSVKVKLISVSGGEYLQTAGFYEGELLFEDIDTGIRYNVEPCLKYWPKFNINSMYSLNLTALKKHTRTNGYLTGCYLGELDELFNQ